MMLKKTFFTFLAAVAVLVCCGSSLDKELRIPRIIHSTAVAAPLPIDGNISANGWEKLSWSGNFVKLASLWYISDRPTFAALAHDKNFLYVGMRLDTPHVNTLKGREKFDLWQNDAAEIFFWNKDKLSECIHLGIDCTGKLYLAKETDIPEMPGSYKTQVLDTRGIKRAVKITSKGWQMTAAIPLNALRNCFGKDSFVNFGRQHRSPYGFDSWIRGEGYRTVRGKVTFEKTKQHFSEKRYAAALKKFASEREKIIGNFKKQIHKHQYAFAAGQGIPNYRSLLTPYSRKSTYGWLSMEGVKSSSLQKFLEKKPFYRKRFASQTMGPLGDNYVYASSPVKKGKVTHTFRIDLPNGEYRVHLLSGIVENETAPFRRTFKVYANGKFVREYENGYLLFLSDTFGTVVKNGKLELTFEGDGTLADDPAVLPLGAGDRKKFFAPGWLINAIVATPVKFRKAAAQQIAADELEIHAINPEELGKYRQVKFADPEPKNYPAQARKQGFALWKRELGVQLYPESRPGEEEFIKSLQITAAPGEFIVLNFGLLPLKDMNNINIKVENLPFLALEESTYTTKLLGGGDYGRVPLFNDRFANKSKDLDKGINRWLWLVGKVPVNAPLGKKLSGKVVITAQGKKTLLPVNINIHPFQLVRGDFTWGGFNPAGYGRPGWARENRLLETCRLYGMGAHTFNVDSYSGKEQWKNLENRLAFYTKSGLKGPFVIGGYLPHKVDQDLRNRKIRQLPESAIQRALDDVAKIDALGKKHKANVAVFFMDEAHCKGEPYWSEQIRLFKRIKEKFPHVCTSGSESDRSIKRVAKYLDMPIVFEVGNYNDYRNFKYPAFYTNQYLLEKNDMNSGRFQTGMIPAFTPMKSLIPWMLYQATGESGFRNSIWNMIQQRGVGGMHFMPKLCVVMGAVGVEDLAYITTLRSMIQEALKSKDPARAAAAREAQETLDSIKEGTQPSVRYYYANGYWKSEVFNQLRQIVTNHILNLKKLEKQK